ncbi:hypothetical protein BJX70DRAFT_378989 [Aspergillus crustosus]
MSQERPQFYKNTLELLMINGTSLEQTLQELRVAVRNGVNMIESDYPPRGVYDGKGIFDGDIGIALAYLRLAQQTSSLGEDTKSHPSFYDLASARIPETGPDLPLQIGGLSPLASKSPLAAVVLRILHKSATGNARDISDSDLTILSDAVKLALSHGSVALYNGHHLGADEVLFGRSGLLWALLNIRARVDDFPDVQRELLNLSLEAIPDLLSAIIQAGRDGAAAYVKKHGDEGSLPLMWPWLPGHYGFGWAHGMAGIIPILLSCRVEELTTNNTNYLPDLGATITVLCRLCISHNGHLPTMVPPRSSRPSELVQICHGAPALLALLGCAMNHTTLLTNYWEPEWEHALRLASERVWDEGLLSKGGSLCHGIAGNAWPFLLLHNAYEYNAGDIERARENYAKRSSNEDIPESRLDGDFFLTRAVAMLLHARETKPYNRSLDTAANDYRMPDRPYSFFEGLSGTVCAWAEACAVIGARLRKNELGDAGFKIDVLFRGAIAQQLGFPCLGGNGVNGFL